MNLTALRTSQKERNRALTVFYFDIFLAKAALRTHLGKVGE